MENKHVNVNSAHQKSLSAVEKFAIFITDKVGTMGFFFIIFIWTLIWMGWNIFAPETSKFDPFPAFVTWLFISNVIQIFLMPLIMIGQNLQGRHAELMAERHYKADITADKHVDEIKKMMGEQTKLLNLILEKLENKK
jgi:uncharacterized membrane protein